MLAAALRGVHQPGAPDRLLQRRPYLRVELFQGGPQRFGGHPYLCQTHSVEPLRVLDQRRVTAMVHVLADRPHLFQGGAHVEVGTGQQVTQGATLGEGTVAQIDSGDHATNSLRPPGASGRLYQWLIHTQPPEGDH